MILFASTFAIFVEVSYGNETVKIRTLGDAGRVLYVYGDNKSFADDWRQYLMEEER